MKVSVFYAVSVCLVQLASVNCRSHGRPGLTQSSNKLERSNGEDDAICQSFDQIHCRNHHIKQLCPQMCYTASDCSPACQNGGTCNDAKKCDCLPGWMGNACDIACGRVNRKTFIHGGEVTEIHEYPWQVAMVPEGSTFIKCGGSLINDRWVLTAAHCTQSEDTMQILLGNHLRNETESAEKRMDIKRIIDHPNYNGRIYDYDFSLLELATPLNLASVAHHIGPVCLPTADNPSQYDNVEAVVSGWGWTAGGGSGSNALLEVIINTMSNSECAEQYRASQIKTSMICGIDTGKGACRGDSGGPMVTEVDGFYNLIGVVSWGDIPCGVKPTVFGRVTHVLDWIASTTSQTGRSAYQN